MLAAQMHRPQRGVIALPLQSYRKPMKGRGPLYVPYGTFDRRVREAVLVFISWTVIALPCPSFREPWKGKGPRNVPWSD